MNDRAFVNKLEAVGEPVFKMAYWLLKDNQQAKDIVQETYLKLWEGRTKYESYINLRQIALKIGRNLCIDHYRKTKKWTMEAVGTSLSVDTLSQQHQLEMQDTQEMITAVINQLPASQRTIMYLSGIEQLTTKEIASITSLSENNIRVTLSRARMAIRKAIKNANS